MLAVETAGVMMEALIDSSASFGCAGGILGCGVGVASAAAVAGATTVVGGIIRGHDVCVLGIPCGSRPGTLAGAGGDQDWLCVT